MPRQKTIIGLDVGSSNIRIAVAQQKDEKQPFSILGVGQAKSQGMRRGTVADIEEVIKNIKEAVSSAERTSGIPIKSAVVSLGGSHLTCRPSRGVIAVSRADGEVSREDTQRAVSAATAISIGPNREIVHVVPRNFCVDSQTSIKDPVGMSGVRLEIDVLILDGGTPYIRNLVKAIEEAQVEVEAVLPSPLAAAKAVLDKRQRELGVLVLDLGGGTTGFTVFEEGDVVDSCVLPVGSGHITNDLAIGLRTSIDVAEKIKLEFGSVLADEISKKEMIDLSKLSGEEDLVSRHEVAEIITARVTEIFDMAYKRLKQIDRAGLLPAGVVLVGGGAKLPGLVDLAKEKLRLPAQIGFPANFEGIVDEVDDPAFATVLGLILWADEENQEFNLPGRFNLPKMPANFNRALDKLKNWLKGFVP